MCTLLIAQQFVDAIPVVVLANRDEFLDRPSLPPALRDRVPPVFCGLDAREGGTWFGINAKGLVVALTNLSVRPPDRSLRSRGLLCMDLLALEDAMSAERALRHLEANSYNPFNIVAIDTTTAVRAVYDSRPDVQRMPPGIYAITNWPLDSPHDSKREGLETRVRSRLSPQATAAEVIDLLQNEARMHLEDADPRTSVCCHSPLYGTKASSIVLLSDTHVRMQHADGPPCSTPYENLSASLARMMSFKIF